MSMGIISGTHVQTIKETPSAKRAKWRRNHPEREQATWRSRYLKKKDDPAYKKKRKEYAERAKSGCGQKCSRCKTNLLKPADLCGFCEVETGLAPRVLAFV